MPPLVGVGVNVTEVPAHIVVADAAILTDGVCSGFTVMVTLLLVAVDGVAQVALLVNTALTTSPLDNPVVVYVLPVVTAILFTLH